MRSTFRLALALLLLGAGAASAQPLTDADLADEKFMHRGTFAADSGFSWARDDIELEAAYTVRCVPGPVMYSLLRQDEDSGQPLRGNLFEDDNVFRDIRRQSIVEAFSIGYPIDQIPWDSDRHAVREANPYVWLTIESGNEARLAAGETQWFKLDLGPGQSATFTATFAHAEGDVDLVLEDEDGRRLRTSTGTGDRERIRYWSAGGRTVYLRVSTKDAAASGPFVLEVR